MSTPSSFPPPPKVRESRFDDWMIRFYKAINSSAGGSSPLSLPFFSVKKYGAKGDGVTDDTLAIQAAAAALSSAGGGALWFEPGKTYRVWSSSPSTLFNWASLNGVIVFGNGATIDTAQTNASYVDVFKLNGCSGVHIRDLIFQGSNTTLTASTGERFVDYHNDCRNITVENCKVYNCRSGLEAAGSPGGTRTKGVRVINCYFERVYYPLQPYRTDNLEARYTSVNAGRSYFPTSPCSHHEIWLDSQQGGPFTDCLIKVYAGSSGSAADNTISDIRLNYFTSGRYSGSGDQDNNEAIVALEIEQADASTASGHLRNFDLNITADCGATDQFANLVTFRRYSNSTPTGDGTSRSHSIRNIRIGGNVTNWNNAKQNGVVLFATTTVNSVAMDWTGDTIDGIALRDLRIIGAPPTDSIYINGQGASSTTQFAILDNVKVDGPITTANVSSANITYRATTASNVGWVENKRVSYTPTWTSTGTQPSLGNGTITGEYRRDGEYIEVSIELAPGSTTTFGTGTYLISIPLTAQTSPNPIGSAVALESGVQYYTGACRLSGSGNITLFLGGTTGNNWGATTPWTLKNGDTVSATYRYRIA